MTQIENFNNIKIECISKISESNFTFYINIQFKYGKQISLFVEFYIYFKLIVIYR